MTILIPVGIAALVIISMLFTAALMGIWRGLSDTKQELGYDSWRLFFTDVHLALKERDK